MTNYNITLNKGRLQAVNMPEQPNIKDYDNDYFLFYGPIKAYEEAVKKAKSEAIDFRPEDKKSIYAIMVNRGLTTEQLKDTDIAWDPSSINVDTFERTFHKEGKTYPVPDGFDIFLESDYKLCGCKIDCRANLRGGKCTATKYARLVPIKEQKPILFSEKQVEQIVFAFCEWKDNWTGTTFSHPPALNDRWLRFQETGDYDKALKRITDNP